MRSSITSRPARGTSATARLRGIKLPSFDIPGIPFRVIPGTGTSSLDFTHERWRCRAHRQVGDSVPAGQLGRGYGGRSMNDIERLVWRVVSGLKDLEVVAELSGSVGSPKLSVSSNLDQAIARTAAGRHRRGGGQGRATGAGQGGQPGRATRSSRSSGRLPWCRRRPPSGSRGSGSGSTRWSSSCRRS